MRLKFHLFRETSKIGIKHFLCLFYFGLQIKTKCFILTHLENYSERKIAVRAHIKYMACMTITWCFFTESCWNMPRWIAWNFWLSLKKIRYSTSLVLTFVLLFYCLYASFSGRIIYFIFTWQSYHLEFKNTTNNWFSVEENFRRRYWREETFLYLCIVLYTNWKSYILLRPIFIYKLF